MTDKFTVYLVDDDQGVIKGLSRLLSARGYQVKAYSSPRVFLDEHDMAVPGCAVLDVSMPGLDGLEIQRVLTAAGGLHRPVVFVTGKGDMAGHIRTGFTAAVRTRPLMLPVLHFQEAAIVTHTARQTAQEWSAVPLRCS